MKALLAPFTVSLIALVAGCGGGSDDTLSPEELVKQADTVCEQVNTETQALPTPTDLKSAASTIDKTVAILEPAQAKLKGLKAPDDLEVAYNAWVAKTAEVVDTAKQAEAAAKKGNEKALERALRKGVEINGQTNALAGKVGLKVCSTNNQQ